MQQSQSHNSVWATGLCICLLWVFCASELRAQTTALLLKNGDRISGTILLETNNLVTLKTSWQKEIIIPSDEIASRQLIPVVVPPVTNAPAIAAAPTTNATVVTAPPVTNAPVVAPPSTNPPATNAPTVAKAPAPAPKPVVVPPPVAPVKPKAPPSWHGDIAIGADVGISEKSRQLYYGKAKVIYAPLGEVNPPGSFSLLNRFRNTFDYNTSYGKTDGILSANRMDGSSKSDLDFGKTRSMFVYNLFGAGYDEIRKIDFRYEIGPGVGYHILARTNFVLNAEVGMNYQTQNFQNNVTTEKYFYRFAEDFTWRFSKKFTFDEKFEFFPQVDVGEFRMRLESNFRFWLLDNLSFTFTVLDLYDSQPAAGVDPNDLQIRSSIGIKF